MLYVYRTGVLFTIARGVRCLSHGLFSVDLDRNLALGMSGECLCIRSVGYLSLIGDDQRFSSSVADLLTGKEKVLLLGRTLVTG